LGFNEFSTEEEQLPDVDLVILNGNIGQLKRCMLYAETLCKKYPDIQFVVNLGEVEYHSSCPKHMGELEESLNIRRSANLDWPKNLHWSTDSQMVTLRNGIKVDILCLYGYPQIYSHSIPWEETIWHKTYTMDILYEFPESGPWHKPNETSNVRHGYCPVFATKDWINKQHAKEWIIARNWEVKVTCLKILVTHINPYKDTRCAGQKVAPYLIHLHNGIWIGSNTECNDVSFLGGRLYSNPGRGSQARHKVITV
jgi:hypothetical protein